MSTTMKSRLMKFGCSCGQRYRLMVRNAGDRFVCRACAAEFVFPGTESRDPAGAIRDTVARLGRHGHEAELRGELDAARARIAELEREVEDLHEQKVLSDRQWVNETLSLYMEFETRLRPRVREAEAKSEELAETAERAKGEVDRAWELIDSGEKAHDKTLALLEQNVQVLERQRKLLLALRPVLKAVADDPELFKARGVDVESLMVRGAVLKALDLLKEIQA